ncbi:hypothetical protein G6F35_012271 [Rhizopus arrhizus]|nr:hypothetical protein G6F35_012271 [Rhizopus arrhizus]
MACAKQVQDAAAVDTYFHAGIEAIWDLGLFGAAESAQLSAQASAGNAEALRSAAQVAVIADVVRSYLDLTVAQAQQDLLARQQAVDDRGEQLALVRQRLRLDEPGELDRLRARQAATRAATAQASENADNAARALALLLGRDGPDPAWRAYRTPPKLGAFSLQQVPADQAAATLAAGQVDLVLADSAGAQPQTVAVQTTGYGARPKALIRSDTTMRKPADVRGRSVCMAEAATQARALAESWGAVVRTYRVPSDALVAVPSGAVSGVEEILVHAGRGRRPARTRVAAAGR